MTVKESGTFIKIAPADGSVEEKIASHGSFTFEIKGKDAVMLVREK